MNAEQAARLPGRYGLPRWTCVIFDLDGTIVDSAPGVIGSIEHAFRRAGLEAPPASELRRWLGPPMLQSLRETAGLDEETAQAVHAYFRANYDASGVLRSEAYYGLPGLLDRLGVAGMPLAIATAKPEAPALVLLGHLGLSSHFSVVSGASFDEGRSSKLEILGEALRRLAERGVDVSKAVVIGDRHHDIEAAAEFGLAAIFVTWGYGDLDEARGALAIADSPEALEVLLTSGRV